MLEPCPSAPAKRKKTSPLRSPTKSAARRSPATGQSTKSEEIGIRRPSSINSKAENRSETPEQRQESVSPSFPKSCAHRSRSTNRVPPLKRFAPPDRGRRKQCLVSEMSRSPDSTYALTPEKLLASPTSDGSDDASDASDGNGASSGNDASDDSGASSDGDARIDLWSARQRWQRSYHKGKTRRRSTARCNVSLGM